MAGNVFLKLGDNIKGEAADPDFSEQIEVDSWGWAGSNSGTMHLGQGRGEGKATIGDLQIHKKADAATAGIWLHLCKGEVIPEAVLTVRGTSAEGGDPVDVCVITMEQVLINNVSISGAGEGGLSESLTLNFRSFNAKYTSPGGAGGEVEYNVAEGPKSATGG